MKKFLIILLIAFVASSTITIETGELGGFFDGIVDKVKGWMNKIGDFVKKLTGKLKDAYNWLKDNGYWDLLIEYIKEYGKPYATAACDSVMPIPMVCGLLVEELFKLL